MEADRLAAGNGEAEPATASPSAAPRSPRPAGNCRVDVPSPPGRVSTRPAGRGWSEGTGASRRCGRGLFLCDFSRRHKKVIDSPGRDPANHRQPKALKTKRPSVPVCAGATNRVRGCTSQRQTHAAGNGEAEPADLLCSAECSPRPAELLRRCLSLPGRVSTRPAGRGWSERGTEARAGAAAGRLVTFSSPQESRLSPGRETRPITANRKAPTNKKQSQFWTLAFAGRRIVTDRHAHRGTTTGQWRSRAAEAFPSATPRCSPRRRPERRVSESLVGLGRRAGRRNRRCSAQAP